MSVAAIQNSQVQTSNYQTQSVQNHVVNSSAREVSYSSSSYGSDSQDSADISIFGNNSQLTEMQETDLHNSQQISERISKGVVELDDLGLGEDVDESDYQNAQSMVIAAQVGLLDYDALSAMMENGVDDPLTNYYGQMLLDAHNNGTPLEELDFNGEGEGNGINMSSDPYAVSDMMESYANPGSGMGTVYVIGQMQMMDMQTAQGLNLATQNGLIDTEALAAMVEEHADASSGTITTATLENMANSIGEDGTIDLEVFNELPIYPENETEEGDSSATISTGMFSTSTAYSIAQMQMTDMQNAQTIAENISQGPVVLDDLGLGDEVQEGDLRNAQSMIAAAQMGLLDYDSLSAMLEEGVDDPLTSYYGQMLLDAHNNGVPFEELDFNGDAAGTGVRMYDPYNMPQIAGMGGSLSTAYSIGQMQMFDQQTTYNLDIAAQNGLIDTEALAAMVSEHQGEGFTITGQYMEALAGAVNEDGSIDMGAVEEQFSNITSIRETYETAGPNGIISNDGQESSGTIEFHPSSNNHHVVGYLESSMIHPEDAAYHEWCRNQAEFYNEMAEKYGNTGVALPDYSYEQYQKIMALKAEKENG